MLVTSQPIRDRSATARANATFVLDPLYQAEVAPLRLTLGNHALGSAADASLRLEIPGVQPQHALIVVSQQRVLLQAMDDRTWVNEIPVKESLLRAGDRLAIGPVEFRVRAATADEVRPDPATTDHNFAATPPEAGSAQRAAIASANIESELIEQIRRMQDEITQQDQKLREGLKHQAAVPAETHRQHQALEKVRQRMQQAKRKEALVRSLIAELQAYSESSLSRQRELERREGRLAQQQAELDRQVEELRSNEESIARLRDELEQQQPAIDRESRNLASQTASLAQERSRIEALQGELEQRGNELDAKNQELSREEEKLRRKLAEFNQTKAHLEERQPGQTAAGVVADNSSERAQLDADRAALETGQGELQAGWESLNQAREELDRARAQLEQDGKELEAGLADLAARRSTLDADSAALQKQREQLQSELERLQQDRSELSDRMREFEAQRQQFADDRDRHEQQAASEQAAESTRLAEAETELQRRREEIEAELQLWRAESEAELQQQRLELEQEREELTGQRRSIEAERERIVAEAEKLQAQREQQQPQSQVPHAEPPITHSDPHPQDASTPESRLQWQKLQADQNPDDAIIAAGGHDTLDAPSDETVSQAPESQEQVSELRDTLASMFGIQKDEMAVQQPGAGDSGAMAPSRDESADHMPQMSSEPKLPEFPQAEAEGAATEQAEAVAERASTGDSPAAEAEDDSIAAYMERLLARNRSSSRQSGVSDFHAVTAQSPPPTQPAPKQETPPAAAPETVESPIEVPQVVQPINDSTDPPQPKHQQDKEAARANLNSLREVANLSARSAIAKHTGKQLRGKALLKFVLSGTAFAVAAVLLTSRLWATGNYTLYGWAALSIGIVMAIELARSTRLLRRSNKAGDEPKRPNEE